MTLYHGGKKRIGLEIAEKINEIRLCFETKGIKFKGYCEPFIGMAGIYKHIPNLINVKKYLAGDANESVIKMWSVKSWNPPKKCTKEDFISYKSKKSPSANKGFIGHACAFRGVYFGSYAHTGSSNRLNKQREDVISIRKILKDVYFQQGIYEQFSSLKDFIIYCDPPYFKQSIYYDEKHTLRKFDTDKFWNWAEKMSENNLVVVSEYTAPKNWRCILKKGNEKLFIIN